MSNLGGYQRLTTLARKVGGPGKLVALIAGGGAVAGALAVKVSERVAEKRTGRRKIERKNDLQPELSAFYTVRREGESNEGVSFKPGDRFRVLESDGDAVLIERAGDDNSPYFVSGKLLKELSDWQGDREQEFGAQHQ